MKTILIVDDDERISELLRQYLENNGFNAKSLENGLYIEQHLENVDLIILDIMMPKMSGFDVIKKLQTLGCKIPVIFLSAKSEANDRINGLELGAYDYVIKPFEPKELLLRIKNILNLTTKNNLKIGEYNYDSTKAILFNDNDTIELSSTENIIFNLLVKNINSPVKRETIIENFDGTISERSVDVQITRIRKKLGPQSELIKTVRHNGYMLISE